MTPTTLIPLATPATKFYLALARRLAGYAQRAYLSTSAAAQQRGPTNAVQLCGGRVLMEDAGDCIIIAFRGTQNIRDWLTDLDVVKKSISPHPGPLPIPPGAERGEGVCVHAGFLAEIDELLPVIIERLGGAVTPLTADMGGGTATGAQGTARPTYQTKPLLITGHSLGGALASLAAFGLSNFPVRAVYTFASPRVGNGAFRDAYSGLGSGVLGLGQKTFQVACAGDLVPLVPGVLDGYRHVGTEVYLTTGRAVTPLTAVAGVADTGAQGTARPTIKINPTHWLEIGFDMWRAYWAMKRGDWEFITQFHGIDTDYIATLDRLAAGPQLTTDGHG